MRLDDHGDSGFDRPYFRTFIFPETQFIAVTAYQNNKVIVMHVSCAKDLIMFAFKRYRHLRLPCILSTVDGKMM